MMHNMTETIHSQIKELNTDDNEDFQLKLLNLGYTAQTWLHKKFYGYTTCFHNFKSTHQPLPDQLFLWKLFCSIGLINGVHTVRAHTNLLTCI